MGDAVAPVGNALGAETVVVETFAEVFDEHLTGGEPPGAFLGGKNGGGCLGDAGEVDGVPIVGDVDPPINVATGFEPLSQRIEYAAFNLGDEAGAEIGREARPQQVGDVGEVGAEVGDDEIDLDSLLVEVEAFEVVVGMDPAADLHELIKIGLDELEEFALVVNGLGEEEGDLTLESDGDDLVDFGDAFGLEAIDVGGVVVVGKRGGGELTGTGEEALAN